MIISVLAENTTTDENYGCEHGLSLYIETTRHKILFDTGASKLFASNAALMGIDLSMVDIAVISHGHHDHGGGLKTFLSINSQAKIYVQNKAFEKHFSHRPNGDLDDIGLDKTLLPSHRFIFIDDHFVVDDELELFSGVRSENLRPTGNNILYMEKGGAMVPDDFEHEQNLMIHENGKTVLVAGCAHNGIVNIVNHLYMQKGRMPYCTIGGFHLYNPSFRVSEEPTVTEAIGKYLQSTASLCYTCHCTGLDSFEHLKRILGDKLFYLSTGQKISVQ